MVVRWTRCSFSGLCRRGPANGKVKIVLEPNFPKETSEEGGSGERIPPGPPRIVKSMHELISELPARYVEFLAWTR